MIPIKWTHISFGFMLLQLMCVHYIIYIVYKVQISHRLCHLKIARRMRERFLSYWYYKVSAHQFEALRKYRNIRLLIGIPAAFGGILTAFSYKSFGKYKDHFFRKIRKFIWQIPHFGASSKLQIRHFLTSVKLQIKRLFENLLLHFRYLIAFQNYNFRGSAAFAHYKFYVFTYLEHYKFYR